VRAAGLVAGARARLARRASVFAAVSLALALPASATAGPGGLDAGYGIGGERLLAPGAVTSSARALAAAPDGSAVVAGRAIQGGAERVLVARLTPEGGLDPAFGGTGMVLARFGADPRPPQSAEAVVLQPDGKALVAGVAGENWFVARYSPTGALDPTFGAAGVVLLPMAGGDDDDSREQGGDVGPALEAGPAGLAVRPDGRILLVGTRADPEDPDAGSIVLVGLLADGKRDPAVGGSGLVISQLGLSSRDFPASSTARALALAPDGRAVVVGSATDRRSDGQAVVARYLANGRLDNAFGDRGKRAVPHPYAALDGSFEGVALAGDGSIVAAGSAPTVPGRAGALVARLTAEGRLDERFGRGGVARMQLGFGKSPQTSGLSVVLDAAGRSVLSGRALAPDRDGSSAVVARLGSDGAVDCGFGNRGRSYLVFSRLDRDAAGGAAVAPVPGDAFLFGGARPEGRRVVAFVARFGGADGARLPPRPPGAALAPRFLSLGGGRIGLGGLVDPRCSTTAWAFEYGERTLSGRTPWRTISAGAGPQDVCVSLGGLRPGRRYRFRLVARSRGGRVRGPARTVTLSREREAVRCVA